MTRDYVKVNGVPIAVEVDGAPDTPAIESELRRIYGAAFRLGRWSRRGKKRRAEVVSDGKDERSRRCLDWLGES